MSCAHIMHGAFSGRFTDHTIFICKLNRRVLFIHETFLVYKLETFKSCKEAKHIIKKKLYGPILWLGFNCLKASTTSRRQFTFFH